jgi:hypothetical protein
MELSIVVLKVTTIPTLKLTSLESLISYPVIHKPVAVAGYLQRRLNVATCSSLHKK